MQDLYPEGYIFMNALYGLAWCDLIDSKTLSKQEMSEGKMEVQLAWNKVNSKLGRSAFDKMLPLQYGSFYNGWSTYLLGRKLMVDDMNPKTDVDLFRARCDSIAAALRSQTYPPSYYRGVWPADVVICVASLSLYDKHFTKRYKDVIANWMGSVKSAIPPDKMVPHSVDANARSVETARGSSLALMLIFLAEIDRELGKAQFELFKNNFLDTRFGLSGVREYRKGKFGIADVDSGPVILGFGGAATIVGMRTLAVYGSMEASSSINKTVQALGLVSERVNGQEYFFGALPMADAFIAWSHAGMRADTIHHNFLRFHALSLAIFFLLSVFFWLVVAPDRRRSEDVLHQLW